MKEPWSEDNIARYFILLAWVEREGVDNLMYLDSDVTLSAPLPKPPLLEACDAMVVLRPDASFAQPKTWTAWAGTSLLSRDVLREFVAFTPRMYSEPHVDLLRRKHTKAPFVGDMTLWFFYVAAADASLREQWGFPSTIPLPTTQPRRFCGALALGYNNVLGRSGSTNRSIHFRGQLKKGMQTWQFPRAAEFDGDTPEGLSAQQPEAR